MSGTPLEDSAADKKEASAFTRSRNRLFQLLEEGQSWSGHERNCAFLNTGGGRFANISAVSGFDFLDDARGLSVVAGALDRKSALWITNRTAPRVRVMRNDTTSDHHFLAVRLQGSTSNRDAIGARAELTIRGTDGERTLSKTVRAGEGFLAQSSKWLTFGLGDDGRAASLSVRWPDGTTEQFADLGADTRYWIVQGKGTADVWTAPSRDVQLAASEPTVPAATLQSAARLPAPIPLPVLQFENFEGKSTVFAGRRNRPLLVNLWASWCLPCARELTEFTSRSEELRAAGLDVLALSVDGLGDNPPTTSQDAQQLLAKLNFPFPSGMATVGLLDKLQILHNHIFALHRPLTVPTSLLIETDWRLVAIYKGPIAVDDLLDDVAQLTKGIGAWREVALPYPGRWHNVPQTPLLPLVAKYFNRKYTDEAIYYTLQNKQQLTADPKFPWMLNRVGHELARRGTTDLAIVQFREALALNGDVVDAHNNLGVALRGQGKLDEAIEHFRRAAELKPDDAAAQNVLGTALVQAGKHDEALGPVRRSLEMNPNDPLAHYLMGHILRSQDKADEAIAEWQETIRIQPDSIEAHFFLGMLFGQQGRLTDAALKLQETLRINPNHVQALENLGNLRLQQGEAAEAVAHFRRALQIQPTLSNTANNLAWILATNPDASLRDGKEAVRWAEQRVKSTDSPGADVLDTLAAAYAEAGSWDEATATARRAIELAKAAKDDALAGQIEAHLKLFEQQQPLRDQPAQ